MLTRTFRLTDKTGVVVLRLTAAIVGLLTEGTERLVDVLWRRLLRHGLVVIAGVLVGVVSLFARMLAGSLRGAGARANRGVGVSAADAMARRAARSEMDSGITEDPLKRQNRLLSVMTVALLVAMIGIVLWATNPQRTLPRGIVPNPPVNPASTALTPVSSPIAAVSTLVPTATQLPEVLVARGSIAYVSRENGQEDIWALSIGSRLPVRLTNSPEDERDPSWDPQGQRLAYASRQDGNWEIYVFDLATNTTTRMTYDLSFQGAPKWSPDGRWLVYESYQGNNLDIYVVPLDGSQPAQRVTENAAPDFAPAWSPDGRRIAFVSWRDGNQDIYVFSLDNPADAAVVNLTNTPTRQEDYPSWSPDSSLIAFSAVDGGVEKVFVKSSTDANAEAQVLERGRQPVWSPDGGALVYAVDSLEGTQLIVGPFGETGVSTLVVGLASPAASPAWGSRPLPSGIASSGGLNPAFARPLFVEQISPPDADGLYRLAPLLGVEVLRSIPYLSDRVNDSFDALRQRTLAEAGWDFLGQLDDAFWQIDRLPQPGEERRNWYMTGRAFGITRNLTAGFPARIELVREDLDVSTYWRLYVRVAEEAQSGQRGEPLRRLPWDMLSRNEGNLQAYDQGGRLKLQVPSGYYIDFSKLASDYGWDRASAGTDWRANFNAINYWLFRKSDGLNWNAAMRELYTEAQLAGFSSATPTISS